MDGDSQLCSLSRMIRSVELQGGIPPPHAGSHASVQTVGDSDSHACPLAVYVFFSKATGN